MRKRTIKYTADTIFWYILYLLPLIYLFISMYSLFRSEQFMSEWIVYTNGMGETFDESFRILLSLFGEILNDPVFTDNLIYRTLYDIFGEYGIVPLFYNGSYLQLLTICSYFVSVYIVHLAVDFLLFIPRLCHKWMNAFTRSDE